MNPKSAAPDLHTQLETLFHAVWEAERRAAVEDRIDATVRVATARDARLTAVTAQTGGGTAT
jgi:hypothetical protein